MPRFSIYIQEVLVGHSMLEHGDPPMGGASGLFVPSPAYASIRRECQINHADQSSLHLHAQTESGIQIPCIGIGILDYSAEVAPPYIEVNVLGIPYPLYGELFPDHVRCYEQRSGDA